MQLLPPSHTSFAHMTGLSTYFTLVLHNLSGMPTEFHEHVNRCKLSKTIETSLRPALHPSQLIWSSCLFSYHHDIKQTDLQNEMDINEEQHVIQDGGTTAVDK